MKKFLAIFLMAGICFAVHAEKLFQYRGIFPAARDSNAFITNYILLKKDTSIEFKVEEQGSGPTDRVKITEIKLTSDPEVVFSHKQSRSRINVKETGIYQVKLEPTSEAGGEIRFILRVVERSLQEDDIATPNASAPVQMTNLPTNQELKSVDDIKQVATQTSVVPDRVVEDMEKFSINNVKIGRIETVEDIASKNREKVATLSKPLLPAVPALATQESASIMENASQSATVLASESFATAKTPQSAVTQEILIVAPNRGEYLNPFNGIQFSGPATGSELLSLIKQHVRVFNLTQQGKKQDVSGTFYNSDEKTVTFLPDDLMPGAVYNVAISLEKEKLERFAVFPELDTQVDSSAAKLQIRLFWPQIDNLRPNPLGQLIRLNDSIITMSVAQNQIMTLDVNQAAPYGSFAGINYIARPYEIVFEIDKQKFASKEMFPLQLKVSASVDGHKDKTEVYNQQITQSSSTVNDRPADADRAKQPVANDFAVIEELADLPANIEFFNISRFSIVSAENEKSRAWPEEVVWSKDGSLWVIDSQRHKLLNFSLDGDLKFSFGEKGKDDGQMGLPVALTVKDGKIFIADRSRKSLHKFSEDGTFLLSISSNPENNIKINLPISLCFRGEELWVADRVMNRVHCFNDEGSYLGGFGKDVEAMIDSPMAIRADSEGLFILEDAGIIKKFTPMGKQIAAFQTGCAEPRGFDVDPWGGIWVCDAGKFQVVRFDQKGRVLKVLKAPPGPRPWMPTSVAVRQDGKIAVTDAENKQVHIFSVEN